MSMHAEWNSKCWLKIVILQGPEESSSKIMFKDKTTVLLWNPHIKYVVHYLILQTDETLKLGIEYLIYLSSSSKYQATSCALTLSRVYMLTLESKCNCYKWGHKFSQREGQIFVIRSHLVLLHNLCIGISIDEGKRLMQLAT